jgi:hypothetical protein
MSARHWTFVILIDGKSTIEYCTAVWMSAITFGLGADTQFAGQKLQEHRHMDKDCSRPRRRPISLVSSAFDVNEAKT